MAVRFLVVTVLLTVFLGIPRFAHHTPDSPHYVDLARYFQGDIQQEQLLKPYASRIVVPFLSTLLPVDNLDTSMALINIAVTAAAFLVFILYMKQLGLSSAQLRVGTLLLVVSFPTFNYSSGVLTDPAGFFVFILGCYLLLKKRYYLLSLAICVGVLVRESLLLLVLIAAIDLVLRYLYQPEEMKNWQQVAKKLIIISIPPIVTFVVAKDYLFPDVPTNFHWGLSFQGFLRNLQRSKMGWFTFPLTLFPPLILILYGVHQNGWQHIRRISTRIKILLFAITIVSVMYIIYSNIIPTAYMSGRFVWPFYSVLIPVSVLSIHHTSVFKDWFEPVACRILGKPLKEE